MPTINAENAKNIRTPFEVHCGLSKLTDEVLSFSGSGAKVMGTLQTNTSLRKLADLSGGGFPLDGSCESYDLATMADGAGMRSQVGGGLVLTVACATVIPAITIRGRGTGVIQDGTTTYDFRDGLVFPINAKTKTLTITNSDPAARLEIESVHPGVEFAFDNDSLVSCTVSLRSDLSLTKPTWKGSEIEINAYWPDDVAEVVSSMGDGSRIWYYAGYTGDRSETRYFYLAEKASQKDHVLTIKGEDASSALDRECPAEALRFTSRSAARGLYRQLEQYVTGSGIQLRHKESIPALIGASTVKSTLLVQQGNARNLVAAVMSLAHVDLTAVGGGQFWPVYVDAGIPTLRHSKPTAKWDIYEEDCGSVVRSAERDIRTLQPDKADYGLTSTCAVGKKVEVAKFGGCVKGKRTTKTLDDGFYVGMTVDPGTVEWQSANKLTFIPGQMWKTKKATKYKKVKGKKVKYTVEQKVKKVNKGTVKVYGYQVTPTRLAKTQSVKRPGVTEETQVLVYGQLKAADALVFPNYGCVLGRSNLTGSFTWKGDPRMQPRDVFTFHRLDGTTELCTIESITLKHQGGGTSADITYRKGVV